jgi:hypothetical protein
MAVTVCVRLCTLSLGLLLGLQALLHADGDEGIGPIDEGVIVASGNFLTAAGAGVHDEQPATITLEIPSYVEVRQVLLYWGMRSTPGDPDVILNEATVVEGDLIGTSPDVPASSGRQPHVYRADITDLELIAPGENNVSISGMEAPGDGFKNGAEIVVIGQDTREFAPATEMILLDGCDFAYADYPEPFDTTTRQVLNFAPSEGPRTAELFLIVGDHVDMSNGDRRPSTLEVEVEGGDLLVIDNPLVAGDGASWDTVLLSVDIPAGSTRVEVQLFSETRAGSRRVPSSFYWLFGGFNVQAPEDEDRPATIGGTVFCDLDEDGVLDDGEPGVAGVPVALDCPPVDDFSGVTLAARTGEDGRYGFTVAGLPEGDVVCAVAVQEDAPELDGKRPTGPSPKDVTLSQGAEVGGVDFGFTTIDRDLHFAIESATGRAGSCVNVRVLMTSNDPVEGLVVAVRHDPEIAALDTITIEGTVSEANGADFVSPEIFEDGGTIGIIMDLVEPFEGNVIPPGVDQPVAVYRYCCGEIPADSEAVVSPLDFVDGELGDPAKENTVVIGGLSFSPLLWSGTLTCEPDTGGEVTQPYFVCGGPTLGDDDLPVQPEAGPGETVELCFYYCSPEDNEPGHEQFDHIQGMTMGVAYDCRLTCLEDTFSIPEDSITAAIDADFVSLGCDNDPDDGDGCELVLATLADLDPPFDGTTFPPTSIPLKVACVEMRIDEDVPCGTCLPVEFRDGVNGPNIVPVKNLYSAENQSFAAETLDCKICVTGAAAFRRADCNLDTRVNISDAAAVLSFLFPAMAQEAFAPTCLDACDSNDDGRVNIADVVKVLGWLFLSASEPPAPGPREAGFDPTEDKLSCDGMGDCS